MNHIIFKAIVGSHAYGTNVEGSDIDIKGVYLQDPLDVLNNGYREQYSVGKDETYYELRRFLELCCTGNPTVLELLWSPKDCILEKDSVFDLLIQHRDKFLSKSCSHSFGGYAYAQIEKTSGLEKKMNWERERIVRKGVLDFCFIPHEQGSIALKDWLDDNGERQEHFALVKIPHMKALFGMYANTPGPKGIVSDEETANDVSLSSVPDPDARPVAYLYFNKDEYSIHCKDYLSYQEWLSKRNEQRYVDIEGHGQKIDGKNLLHCYRLIETAIEIAREGTIRVHRPNADFLKEIRHGKHDLQTLLEGAKIKIEELGEAFKNSSLPDKADRGFFMSLMVKIRNQHYKNHDTTTL